MLHIEQDPTNLSAVQKLAKLFDVPQVQLMELAGFSTTKEQYWLDEVIRYVAHLTLND